MCNVEMYLSVSIPTIQSIHSSGFKSKYFVSSQIHIRVMSRNVAKYNVNKMRPLWSHNNHVRIHC